MRPQTPPSRTQCPAATTFVRSYDGVSSPERLPPMEGLIRLAAALIVAFTLAMTAFLLHFLFPKISGRWIGWAFMTAIMTTPLLIPAELIGLRALAAFLVTEAGMKVVDELGRREQRSFTEFLWFLIPFPSLAVVFPDHKRRLKTPDSPWLHLLRLIFGSLVVIAGFVLLHQMAKSTLLQSNFALNHVLIVLLFIPVIESISQAMFGLERLLGFATTPIMNNLILSRTPAEFWQRYNRRVHDWLIRNVFLPLGGARAPVRGVILVFVFSAVFHELMFDIATSTIDGCQLLFFLIQIPAVLASRRLERFARRNGVAGALVAHASTILFLMATSVLFFRGVSRIFPFVYAAAW